MAENTIDNIIEVDIHNIIVQLYVGYYGRPPDPEGLAWWVEEYYPNHTLQETINAFGESDEYTAHFGDFPDSELIHNLYQQVFGRDADSERLKHYKALLESGEETLATIAYTIMSDAKNEDVDILALKVKVAEIFTDTLGKTLCDNQDYGPHSYDSSEDALLVRDYLLGVTDPSEIEAYKVAITDIAYTQFLEGVPICGEDGQSIVVDIIAPVFSFGSNVQVDENLPTSSPVYDAQAFDSGGEADVGITYRLPSRYDNHLFTISEGGIVYFRDSPDYENPLSVTQGNHYRILIEASDKSGNTNDKLIFVKILDVDEIAPVFVSGSYAQKNENLSHWNQVYDAQAIDSSGKIDEGITYRLPFLKWDNALFTINQQNGIVYFIQIPDYENPFGVDNNYTLLIEASDESGNTSDKIVNLKILDVDENPRSPPFTVNSRDAVIVAGSTGEVTEDSGKITGTLVVTDPDDLPSTSIYSSKVLSSKKGSFTIDPNTGEWEYEPFLNFYGTDHAVVVVMDALGNTSKVSIDFTVTAVVDLIANNDVFTVKANSTNNIRNVSLNDITDSGGSLSYDAVTYHNIGNGLFSIDNSGSILYTPAKGFVGTDTVTYTVQDPTANEETTASITFNVGASISEISFTWNSTTSTFTAEASSTYRMQSVTVKDGNNGPVIIGNPRIKLDGGDGLITFDFSGAATANFDNWTFTFIDSNGGKAEATYDVIITSEKDIHGEQDAEIFLLRPWDANDDFRNVWGSKTKYDYGTEDLADQIFIARPDTEPNDQYINPTVGSHIEGTAGVFTTVSFDVFKSHIELILAEPGGTSTAKIYANHSPHNHPIAGVVTMTYVDGIVGDYGDDELTGNSQDNFIYGEDGADILKGGGGNDFLSGGEGHDVLFGGPGNNTIDGGRGMNTASYAGFSIDLTIDLGTNTHTVKDTDSGSNEVFDTLKNITIFIGGSGNDTFQANDSSFKWFVGGDGDDHFHGYKNVFFEGGNNADTFHIDFTPGNKVTITDYNKAEGDIIKSTTAIPIDIKTVANKGAFATINSGGVLDAGFTFLAEEEVNRNVTQLYAVRGLLSDNNVTLSTPSQKSLVMVTNGTASAIWYIQGDGDDDLTIEASEMTMVVFLVGVTCMDEVTFVDLF